MSKKASHITVTDQFCGAGGSSQGVRRLAMRKDFGNGLEVRLALNHWKLAIETHNTNFPDTMHDCTDVSACDPRRYPSTDILITSPECTNHSLAKGQKIVKKQMDLFNSGKVDPAAERSRATMWDVPRFAEYHKYNIIVVENVVDARNWVMYDAWLMAMHALGYNHKAIYHNSMHHFPTPQSRDRMYVVFWKKGNKAPNLEFNPVAFCPKCETNVSSIQTWKKHDKQFGKYKQQYVFSCPSCTRQVEPYYYAALNIIDWSDIGTRIGDREKPLSENTVKRIEYGLKKYGNQWLQVVNQTPGFCRPLDQPAPTYSTIPGQYLLSPPLVMHTNYGEEARGVVRNAMQAMFTQTARTSQAMVSPPLIINNAQSTGIDYRVRSAMEQLPTTTTNHQPNICFPVPFLVKLEHGYKSDPVSKALRTSTTRQSDMLINIRTTLEVMQTQTTAQGQGIVVPPPMLVEMSNHGEAKPVDRSLNTLTAGGINHSLFAPAPLITTNRGQSMAHGASDPITTQSSKVNHGIVTTEAWNSFFSYWYGTHQASHITEAARTFPATDSHQLVTFEQPKLEDCYYRMLKPEEVKLGMAFDRDYVILGNSRDKVKQCGNAVTPPVMEWIIERCIESLS